MGPLGGVPPEEQLLTITQAAHPGCAILIVRGDIDLSTGERLAEAAEHALSAAGTFPLVLDLSGVKFLSSSGLGLLVDLDDRARACGSSLRLVAGEAESVTRPIRTLGLNDTLDLYRSVDEATAC